MKRGVYDHLGDMAEAWKAYKERDDQEARERLILNYLPLVKHICGQLAMGMPAEVQPSDLETYGIFGLMDAMGKFDLDKKIKFKTYAVIRIRGAILDGVRKMDWVPSSLRRRGREIHDANHTLRTTLGRQPTEGEMALYLGITVERLRQVSLHIAKMKMIYLDEAHAAEDVSNLDTLLKSVPDERASDPFEEAVWRTQRDRIADAIGRLNAQQQLVITLCYYEELTLGEISEVLELSPSRISQVRTESLRRLRAELSSDREFHLAIGR